MAHRRASEVSSASESGESGLHPRALTRYALREGSVEYPLNKTPLVVGRGSDADIVLSGPLVSRRHAEFHQTEAGVVVLDLDSRNGVLVNDVPISGSAALLIGDRLTIGEGVLVLAEMLAPRDAPSTEPAPATVRESRRAPAGTHAASAPEASLAARRADALHLLGNVADKALALGRGQEAEHMLGTHLVAALSDAVAGREVAPEVARVAAQYAVKLASANTKASWLDFAFRLYEALGETIPLPIVDEMYTVLRHVRGVDRELLHRYTELLRGRSAALSPPERFVLQRLEGLERLAAHLPAS